MKVTPNTSNAASLILDDFKKEAQIRYWPRNPENPVARVIEFPRVWREYGKQYVVRRCLYSHNGDWSDHIIVRAPHGVEVETGGCDHCTLERY